MKVNDKQYTALKEDILKVNGTICFSPTIFCFDRAIKVASGDRYLDWFKNNLDTMLYAKINGKRLPVQSPADILLSCDMIPTGLGLSDRERFIEFMHDPNTAFYSIINAKNLEAVAREQTFGNTPTWDIWLLRDLTEPSNSYVSQALLKASGICRFSDSRADPYFN
jgi:hypothetical protein